jgi:hypothetical protein
MPWWQRTLGKKQRKQKEQETACVKKLKNNGYLLVFSMLVMMQMVQH